MVDERRSVDGNPTSLKGDCSRMVGLGGSGDVCWGGWMGWIRAGGGRGICDGI